MFTFAYMLYLRGTQTASIKFDIAMTYIVMDLIVVLIAAMVLTNIFGS